MKRLATVRRELQLGYPMARRWSPAAGDVARCYPEHIHNGMSERTFRCRCIPMAGTSTTRAAEFDLVHKREKLYLIKVADEHAQA